MWRSRYLKSRSDDIQRIVTLVYNLWITRRTPVQLIHIFAMYLTASVRWIRLKRAAEADGSLRRIRLLPQLCLCIGLLSVQMQHATASNVDHYKLYAHSRIINDVQYQCLSKIIYKESRWNPAAKNGSHYGLGQMRSQQYRNLDAYRQIDATIRYIKVRYGSMCKAWEFHKVKGYY
jgi:hypothetical protein